MFWIPPDVSPAWTADERIAVVGWISRITLDRIARDDPATPFVAKRSIYELFRAIEFITAQPSLVLEEYRAILLKPYDSSLDHHGVEMPPDVYEAMKRAAGFTDHADRWTPSKGADE